jgi:murein DD-endopeptidase MepM/ murein hydrolase activator NlpD
VAVESGVIDRASPVERGLGGITIWLRGHSGTRYYYAHHQRDAVTVGMRVTAGQIVGYVGNTGNARTTSSHLHFEMHPDGGTAIDPFATVSRICGRSS